MKTFIYGGKEVPMKTGATGIRFLTLDDAENNRNPLYKGDTKWRKAPYEMHLVTSGDMLCLSPSGINTSGGVRKSKL